MNFFQILLLMGIFERLDSVDEMHLCIFWIFDVPARVLHVAPKARRAAQCGQGDQGQWITDRVNGRLGPRFVLIFDKFPYSLHKKLILNRRR